MLVKKVYAAAVANVVEQWNGLPYYSTRYAQEKQKAIAWPTTTRIMSKDNLISSPCVPLHAPLKRP